MSCGGENNARSVSAGVESGRLVLLIPFRVKPGCRASIDLAPVRPTNWPMDVRDRLKLLSPTWVYASIGSMH